MSSGPQIIAPPQSATGPFYFPTPRWDYRRCVNDTQNCTNHGVCNANGACECFDGFTGLACGQLQRDDELLPGWVFAVIAVAIVMCIAIAVLSGFIAFCKRRLHVNEVQLRLRSTGGLPDLALPSPLAYHMFISHTSASFRPIRRPRPLAYPCNLRSLACCPHTRTDRPLISSRIAASGGRPVRTRPQLSSVSSP